MDEIKIAEWNVNFKAGTEVKIADFVKDYISNKIDVIVFTEIVKTKSVIDLMKNMAEFNFYESVYEKGKNQVIIAVKKDFAITSITTQLSQLEKNYSGRIPDFLQIEMLIEDEKYCIIGTRIKIGKPKDEETTIILSDPDKYDYEQRLKQFEILLNHVKKIRNKKCENVIILGDFNNGMKFDNCDMYNRIITDGQRAGKPSLLKYYNYQMIENQLGNDFEFYPSEGDSSWGLKHVNDKKVYGKIKNNIAYGSIKNDHMIISKNVEDKVIGSQYDWNFVQYKNIEQDYEQKYEKMLLDSLSSKNETNGIDTGYPDHAILKATIKLQKKTR